MGTTIDDIECRDRQYQLLVPRQVCNVLSKPIKTPINLKEGTRSNKCNPWTKEPTGPCPNASQATHWAQWSGPAIFHRMSHWWLTQL